MNYFNLRSRIIAVVYKISNIFGIYCLRGFRLPEKRAHSAFAPHQIVAQRRGGRVDAVWAGAGNVFVIVAVRISLSSAVSAAEKFSENRSIMRR